ncbi:hypothetical protein OAR16_00345 [bacterium]|nr:hypothetical protein [bacterium]
MVLKGIDAHPGHQASYPLSPAHMPAVAAGGATPIFCANAPVDLVPVWRLFAACLHLCDLAVAGFDVFIQNASA